MSANDKQVGGDHYRTRSGMQHWDWCWENRYDQFQYCITKYVDRHKRKNGLEDLYKARHHLEKYIELLEAEKVEVPSGIDVTTFGSKTEEFIQGEPGSGYTNQDR